MSNSNEIPQLTIKDRVNTPYILASQILTFQKAILNNDGTFMDVNEAIKGLVDLIPNGWYDDEYKKELKKAVIIQKVDNRPTFCGIRASEKFCKENNIALFIEKKVEDPHKMLHTVVNLLNRRGLWGKEEKLEKIDGVLIESTDEP